jgi:hypothetical protein
MALVQGIYDLGKPGREQTLYTNRRDDAPTIQENFVAENEFAEKRLKQGTFCKVIAFGEIPTLAQVSRKVSRKPCDHYASYCEITTPSCSFI